MQKDDDFIRSDSQIKSDDQKSVNINDHDNGRMQFIDCFALLQGSAKRSTFGLQDFELQDFGPQVLQC